MPRLGTIVDRAASSADAADRLAGAGQRPRAPHSIRRCRCSSLLALVLCMLVLLPLGWLGWFALHRRRRARRRWRTSPGSPPTRPPHPAAHHARHRRSASPRLPPARWRRRSPGWWRAPTCRAAGAGPRAGDGVLRDAALPRRHRLGAAGRAQLRHAEPVGPRAARARASTTTSSTSTPSTGVIFVIACYTFPYVFVLSPTRSSASRPISRTPRRSSAADRWHTLRRVTLPLVLPSLLAGALVAFLQALTLFGTPAILAMPGGFHVLTTQIWSLFQYPAATRISPRPRRCRCCCVTLLLLRGQRWLLGRRGYAVVGGKNSAAAPRSRSAAGAGRRCCSRCCPRAAGVAALFRAAQGGARAHAVRPAGLATPDLRNIRFAFVEFSATRLALANTLHPRRRQRDRGHGARPGRRLSRRRAGWCRAHGCSASSPWRRSPSPASSSASACSWSIRGRPSCSTARCGSCCSASSPWSCRPASSRSRRRCAACIPSSRRRRRIFGASRLARLVAHHRAAAALQHRRDLVHRLHRRHPRAVGDDPADHLQHQGGLGRDLRPQRERRPRRDLRARHQPSRHHLRSVAIANRLPTRGRGGTAP